MLIALCALLGAVIGSFLNVCMDRLPQGGSLLSPASHCPACSRPLKPSELVPILSYLALRGRCAACGAAIPRRVLAVEISTAALFAWLAAHYGAGWPLVAVAIYTSILLVIFVIDLEHRLVLNRVTYPAAALALAVAGARSLAGDPLGLAVVIPTMLAAVGGGLVGFGVLFLPAWLTRGGIGGGDVKLGALMGVMLGLPVILAGLFWGFVAGGVGAIVLLATGLRGRRDAVPYAPFLCLGAWVAMVYGSQMVSWYAGRF